MQVLRLICADRSNAEIGAILNIKLPTVKTHVRHILDETERQPPQRGEDCREKSCGSFRMTYKSCACA